MNAPQILMIIWLVVRVFATLGVSVGRNADIDDAQIAKDTLKVLFQMGVIIALLCWGGFWK